MGYGIGLGEALLEALSALSFFRAYQLHEQSHPAAETHRQVDGFYSNAVLF